MAFDYPFGQDGPEYGTEPIMPPPIEKPGGLKPPPYAGPGPKCQKPAPPPPPPPIPPIGWIPGANMQEQLSAVMAKTNQCIEQWNHISRECYKALNDCREAAISNDVYYDRDEVSPFSGYDESEECAYHVIAIRAVDKCGHPIRTRLALAFNNTTNSGITQPITDVSYITNANAIITAVSPSNAKWTGPAMFAGGAIPGETGEGRFVAGFNRHGVLKVFASDTDPNVLYQNKMVDVIGPVIPIIQEGAVTTAAQGMTAKKNICAIGWRRSDGMKFFFWAGCQEDTGMSGITVADILSGYDCTTAIVTAYEDPAPGPEYVDQNGSGMEYMGTMPTAPIGWAVPNNSAYWVVSKRPFRGWRNKFESEIADLVQKTGKTQNDVNYIGYKVETVVDIAQEAIEKADQANDRLDVLEPKVEDLENRMAKAETDITGLRADLTDEINRAKAREDQLEDMIEAETTRATAAETQLRTDLTTETNERTAADKNLQEQITTVMDNLTQEIQDRTEADTNLNNAILAEQLARSTADTRLENLIEAEEAARQLADSQLQQTINNIIDGSQVIEITPDSLPIASPTQLGAIKVGANLTITEDGTLNAEAGGGGGSYTAGPGISITGTTIQTDNNYLNSNLGFLPLAGGTMTGNIVAPDTFTLENNTDGITHGLALSDASGQKVATIRSANSGNSVASNVVATSGSNGALISVDAVSNTGTAKVGITAELNDDSTTITVTPNNVTFAHNGSNATLKGVENGTEPNDAVNVVQLTVVQNKIDGVIAGTTPIAPGALPVASATALGAVQIGNGLNITPQGVLSVDGSSIVGDYLPLAGGTMTGAIVMGNNKITGLAAGTITGDAVNFGQLTEVIDDVSTVTSDVEDIRNDLNTLSGTVSGITSGSTDLPYLKLSGGTMTGDINLGPTNIKGQGGAYFNLYTENALQMFNNTGSLMFAINANNVEVANKQIKNVATPTQSGDAVNLGYIQTNIGTGPFLPLSGGTMTGNISAGTAFTIRNSLNSGISINSDRSVQLNYNGASALKVTANEVTVTNRRITNVADPTNDNDAVNYKSLNRAISGGIVASNVIIVKVGEIKTIGTVPQAYRAPGYRVIVNISPFTTSVDNFAGQSTTAFFGNQAVRESVTTCFFNDDSYASRVMGTLTYDESTGIVSYTPASPSFGAIIQFSVIAI